MIYVSKTKGKKGKTEIEKHASCFVLKSCTHSCISMLILCLCAGGLLRRIVIIIINVEITLSTQGLASETKGFLHILDSFVTCIIGFRT